MRFPILFTLAMLSSASAFGSISLNISVESLENSSGVAANGMRFGIVVDTDANGFEAGSYTGFDITTNGQYLTTTSGVTGDWFVYGGTQGTSQIPPQTSGAFPQPSGSISIVNSIEFTNLTTGDEFAVIWFPEVTGTASSGDEYGFFTDTGATQNMIIPADTGVSSAPTSISTKSVNFQVVPEPSTLAFFGLFGFIFLFVRRRPAV